LSLVWDAIEPLRPNLVRSVFGYVETHRFEKKDFLTGERTVRLAPPLAKEIAPLAIRTVGVPVGEVVLVVLIGGVKKTYYPYNRDLRDRVAAILKERLDRLSQPRAPNLAPAR
jgi:hypothetical protein